METDTLAIRPQLGQRYCSVFRQLRTVLFGVGQQIMNFERMVLAIKSMLAPIIHYHNVRNDSQEMEDTDLRAEKTSRPMNDLEIMIIKRLLSPNLKALMLFNSISGQFMCSDLDEFGSVKIFPSVELCPDRVSGPVFSGRQPLTDGTSIERASIEFVLFFRNGMMDELQIYSDDGAPICVKIDPTKIELV